MRTPGCPLHTYVDMCTIPFLGLGVLEETNWNTAFGSALAEHLSALEGCELRLTDRTEQPGDPRTRLPDPFWLSQLDDSEATHALLDGVDQIIHAEPFAAGDMPLRIFSRAAVW